MRFDRPPPGEELNAGDETLARPAASVIVLRDAPSGPEVLLVKRNPDASFMGGAWVFPGGSVHDDDGGERGAAIRELREEAAIELAGEGELEPFSRWITPAMVKKRFDTWFFVARAPEGQEPRVDGVECVAFKWIFPADALAEGERGELMLVFPTIKHLEQLTEFHDVDHALATAREREVQPVQPQVVMHDDHARVVLPGEPGYDA